MGELMRGTEEIMTMMRTSVQQGVERMRISGQRGRRGRSVQRKACNNGSGMEGMGMSMLFC